MSLELQLPDLPELPIALGPAAPAVSPRLPWHLRLLGVVSAGSPLLLMALLALASWWLVKNSPMPLAADDARAVSKEPDYTMTRFALERFDAGGRLKLRIEGAVMRHYPADDHIEIESAQIRALSPDGRVTLAHAQRALGNGDGSELELLGGAEVSSVDGDGDGAPLLIRGEFLHAWLVTERVSSPLPVVVLQGGAVVHAAGLDYDHAAGRLDLKGPMRAELPPRADAASRAAR